VAERTRQINRLRKHMHEIGLVWDPSRRCLTTFTHLRAVAAGLAGYESVIAPIAADVVWRIHQLTVEINSLGGLDARTSRLAPTCERSMACAGRAGMKSPEPRIAVTQSAGGREENG